MIHQQFNTQVNRQIDCKPSFWISQIFNNLLGRKMEMDFSEECSFDVNLYHVVINVIMKLGSIFGFRPWAIKQHKFYWLIDHN